MPGLRDPTRSATLRRKGRAIVQRRVFELHRSLRQALDEQDVIGLRASEQPTAPLAFINWLESASYKLSRAEGLIAQLVERALEIPHGWPTELIAQAVERGIEQVEQELSTTLGHLDAGEVSRLHARAASLEVRGIAGETQRRLLRHVVRALEAKASPEALMRELRMVLEKITRLRLNLMINTGVVRAVNAGKLFAYASQGIRQVGIDPEYLPHHTHDSVVIEDAKSRKAKRRKKAKARAASKAGRRRRQQETEPELVGVITANDDKVCDICEEIAENGPYFIEAARDLIPAHVNCRCAFVSAEIEREFL